MHTTHTTQLHRARMHCRDTANQGRCYQCGSAVDRWSLTEHDLDRAARLPESVNFRCDYSGRRRKDGLACDYCAGPDDLD